VPGCDQSFRSRRHQRDAVFVGLDLFGDAYLHVPAFANYRIVDLASSITAPDGLTGWSERNCRFLII
jgi:hypothetical protein